MNTEAKRISLGLLYDFSAFLTGRKEEVRCSSKHTPDTILEALKSFSKLRNLDDGSDCYVSDWETKLEAVFDELEELKKIKFLENIDSK